MTYPIVSDIEMPQKTSVVDYTKQLFNLLPKGKIWADHATSGSLWARLLNVFAGEFHRAEEDTLKIYEEVNPISATDFARWSTLSGDVLDEYTITLTDTEEREIMFEQVFGLPIHITAAVMQQWAANLGWNITLATTIIPLHGFEMNNNEMGDNQMGGYYDWTVVSITTLSDDGSSDWDTMRDLLLKKKPAHIILDFLNPPDEGGNIILENGYGLLLDTEGHILREAG